MRLHHFFIEQKINEETVGKELAVPDPSLAHQLRNVFRFREGGPETRLVLLDNSGFQYLAHIVSLDKDGGVFYIEGRHEWDGKPHLQISLFQSLVKKDTFEWIAEKATELGVAKIVPVLSERSEKKSLNLDQCLKIVKEASEQSGRAILPVMCETRVLDQAIEDFYEAAPSTSSSLSAALIAFDPKGEPFKRSAIEAIKAKNVGVLIGPEGGWSDQELALMQKKQVQVFSFGSQILRAETAAISALSLLLLSQ